MTEIEKRLHLAFLSSLAALSILSPFALYFSAISAYFAYIIWAFFLFLIRKNIKISYTWVLLKKKEPVPVLIMTYYWIVSITSFSPMFYLWPIIQKKGESVTYNFLLVAGAFFTRELLALGGKRKPKVDT